MLQANSLLGSQGGQASDVFQGPEALKKSSQREGYEDLQPMKWHKQADTEGVCQHTLHKA
jgi:hypothetical protein